MAPILTRDYEIILHSYHITYTRIITIIANTKVRLC